jgi:hypothetical protein
LTIRSWVSSPFPCIGSGLKRGQLIRRPWSRLRSPGGFQNFPKRENVRFKHEGSFFVRSLRRRLSPFASVLLDRHALDVQGEMKAGALILRPACKSAFCDTRQELGGLTNIQVSTPLLIRVWLMPLTHRKSTQTVETEPKTTQQFAPEFKGLFIEPWEADLNREIWNSGPEKGFGAWRSDAAGGSDGE